MKNKAKINKIIFIICVSLFTLLWITSLVFLGIATLSESATNNIQSWYASKFENKTLNLLSRSIWLTLISTTCLVITLLTKEIKKKYIY